MLACGQCACIWFLETDLICDVCVCVSVCLSVCLPPKLVITSGVIWTSHDWLNKFYSFYIAAVFSIVSRCDLIIEAHQPNKSRLVLCKPLIHFNSHLKQLYISNKMECFSYKGGCDVYGLQVLRCLKE